VKVPELDLEVAPGSNATGYVSNVEGVLNRFIDIIQMVLRDLQSEVERINETAPDDEATLEEAMTSVMTLVNMLEQITTVGEDNETSLTLELLDPHGHSMIIHEDALHRELDEEELLALPVGPDPAVFSSDDEA
jgi:zinc finger protein